MVLEKDGNDQLGRSVRNEVLHRVKKVRKILCTIIRRKVKLIGRILRRNCLQRHVIERKTEGII